MAKRHIVVGDWVIRSPYTPNGAATYHVKLRNKRTGKIRKLSTRSRSKREAVELAKTWAGQHTERPTNGYRIPTFAESFVEFLSLKDCRPTTLEGYRYDFERVYSPRFGERRTDDITIADIEEFLRDLKDQGLKARTRSKHLIALRSWARFCLRRKWIVENPCDGIRSPRGPRKQFPLLTPDQARVLLGECRRPYLKKAVALGFLTGIRRSAILALRVSDLDLDARRLTVRAETAKNGRAIELPVRDDLLRLLLQEIPGDPDSALLVRDLRNISTGFGLARKRAGFPWFTFHSTRRCFASWLSSSGCSYPCLKSLLGHSTASGDVTLRYTMPSWEERVRAVNVLPGILDSGVAG